MATEKLPIIEAGDDQLRDFCEIQGLDPSKAGTRAKLLACLEAAWPHPYILIQAAVAPAEGQDAPVQFNRVDRVAPQPGQVIESQGLSDPMITVRLSNTEGPGGKQPVPIGVNGRTIVVQRQMNVKMPYRFYLALRNAIRQEIEPDDKGVPMDPVDVECYPCHVVDGPTQREIDDWHDSTRDELMPA